MRQIFRKSAALVAADFACLLPTEDRLHQAISQGLCDPDFQESLVRQIFRKSAALVAADFACLPPTNFSRHRRREFSENPPSWHPSKRFSTTLVRWICRKSTAPRVDDFTGASRGGFVVIIPAINTPPEFPQASEFRRVHRGGFAANSPRAGHRDNRNYLKLTGGKDPQPILPFPTLPWRQVVRKIA